MTRQQHSLSSLALALTLLASGLPAFAEEPSNEALAKELMVLSVGADMSQEIAGFLSAQLRPAYPLVPEETWVEVFETVDGKEVEALIAGIYTRHFTRDELLELVAFYKSPIGKRFVELLPVVMQESMALGNEWNQRKVNEVVEALKARGHNPQSLQ
ncbi:MAG: DUF2059 domain-containing protein [Myxococcota bacterium]|jgi:hypothetical protein|nr:DUF2059 domain-containing protein [Myxococcota bacterium]